MGFKIQSLKFSQADTTLYPENIIKVDMTLQRADGERAVETTRYVECYNFITAQDFDKIKDDSSGETPPPDVPDEPDKPDKDGEGSIIIDPDDNIDFVTNDVTYRELREEAREDKDKKILIPKGIYEEHGQYYIIPVDTQRTFYDLPGNLNAYWTQVRGENLCFKVNADKLYTEADIVTPSQQSHWTNWKDGKSPEMGSIYFYKGRYYVCIEPAGGYAPVDPVNSSNWYDITEFVKKLE